MEAYIPINTTIPVLPTSRVNPVRNGRGIVLMILAMFFYSAADVLAKLLTDSMHPVQIAWARQIGLMTGVVIMIGWNGFSMLRAQRPGLQLLRGVLAVGSSTAFIFAIGHVPLADAVAVSFVAPFIVTVLGALILREPVGLRRWAAVLIGFAGTLIVIRPGMGVLHPAVFLVVLAASLFAIRQVLSRVLASTDRTATTVAYTALTATILLSIPLPFVWVWPSSPIETALMLSIAVLAALAELLVIKSLEVAQAVAVAPMQYTLMIWGTFYGFMVFGQLPDGWTSTGAAIIIATGIYTLNRERIAEQVRRRESSSLL